MALINEILMILMSLLFGLGSIVHLVILTLRYGYSAVWTRKTRAPPDCLSDAALGEHRYVTVNGIKLHYVISGPEEKPLMLFLHGFPEFWYTWRHQIKEFQKDYRVVAVDQRGYGSSEKPDGVDNYKVSILLQDIRQLIQALGYKSCVLVSHDWGGVVGWAFARFFPEMVDKLIVMNAPSQPAFDKMLKTNKTEKRKSWGMCFFQLPYLPELMMRSRDMDVLDSLFGKFSSQDELAAYKYTFSQPSAWTYPINWYRSAFGPDGHEIRYDMHYLMPVLLIWGVQDTSLNIELVALMEKDCPEMEVKRISEAGHFVQEEKPEEVNAVMREWLGKE